MRQAVLSRRPGAAKSQSLSLPSPIGGLNARDSVANMKGTDALQMDNWFPQTTDVAVRRGTPRSRRSPACVSPSSPTTG